MNIVTFCGIDGCGKSTYIDILQQHYKTDFGFIDPMKNGTYGNEYNAILKMIGKTNVEPSKLKGVVYALNMLEKINAIDDDRLYISHRFKPCCWVYAKATHSHSTELEQLLTLIPNAILTFFIKIDADTAFERIAKRSIAKKEPIGAKEDKKILHDCANYYEQYISKFSNSVITIDGAEEIDTNMSIILHEINKLPHKQSR
ncbi:MAG: hypothetical protein LBQ15_12770 [Clostridium sp.]|jgi:thymidylate kinase|nr:hypothetical protein [Clostridium sp.]